MQIDPESRLYLSKVYRIVISIQRSRLGAEAMRVYKYLMFVPENSIISHKNILLALFETDGIE